MLLPRDVIAVLFGSPQDGYYTCETCGKRCKSTNGFTNLFSHLRRYHPDFRAEAEIAIRSRNVLRLRVIDERTRAIYRWCELIVMERLPFSFCERQLVRKNFSLSAISVETLMRYLGLIEERTVARVAEALPERFGLVIDGWSSGSRHYVAVFAVFAGRDDHDTARADGDGDDDLYDDLHCSNRQFLLLAFRPLFDESDLSAQSVFDLIADTLSTYEKPWESVLFMVGDNCSVNQYIGRREGAIPLIGCASHRFQLAVKDYMEGVDAVITKVHALMIKLRSIKGRATLRTVTPLAPKIRNDTRWSSAYVMLARYVALVEPLGQIGHAVLSESEIQPLLLTRAETESVRAVLVDFEIFEAVTKTLQRSTLTLSGVRRLFDHVLLSYPQMASRLSSTASVVNYPSLESGLIKLQRREAPVAAERVALFDFRLTAAAAADTPTPPEQPSFVRSAFTRPRTTRRQQYMDVAFVPPTSNECERFFSRAKLVFTDLRKRMEPETLEMVMFLMLNKALWSEETVLSIRQDIGPE